MKIHDDTKSYFDYKSQTWVTGEAGRQIRIAQLREELEILTSGNGANYLKFLASKLTRAEAVDKCVVELHSLGAPEMQS